VCLSVDTMAEATGGRVCRQAVTVVIQEREGALPRRTGHLRVDHTC
jgi:hypothetical protein